jgi:hypothetical protein
MTALQKLGGSSVNATTAEVMSRIMTYPCGELLNLKEAGKPEHGKSVFSEFEILYKFVQDCVKQNNTVADNKSINTGIQQFFKNSATKLGGSKYVCKKKKTYDFSSPN